MKRIREFFSSIYSDRFSFDKDSETTLHSIIRLTTLPTRQVTGYHVGQFVVGRTITKILGFFDRSQEGVRERPEEERRGNDSVEEGMEEELVGIVRARREVGSDGSFGKLLGVPLQREVSSIAF